MMRQLHYIPAVHTDRYPMTTPCGALLSAEGEEDRICDTEVRKHAANQRCAVCAARRKKAAVLRSQARAKAAKVKARAK